MGPGRGRRGSGRRRLRELTRSVVDTMEILEEVRGKHPGVSGMSKALVQVCLNHFYWYLTCYQVRTRYYYVRYYERKRLENDFLRLLVVVDRRSRSMYVRTPTWYSGVLISTTFTQKRAPGTRMSYEYCSDIIIRVDTTGYADRPTCVVWGRRVACWCVFFFVALCSGVLPFIHGSGNWQSYLLTVLYVLFVPCPCSPPRTPHTTPFFVSPNSENK